MPNEPTYLLSLTRNQAYLLARVLDAASRLPSGQWDYTFDLLMDHPAFEGEAGIERFLAMKDAMREACHTHLGLPYGHSLGPQRLPAWVGTLLDLHDVIREKLDQAASVYSRTPWHYNREEPLARFTALCACGDEIASGRVECVSCERARKRGEEAE